MLKFVLFNVLVGSCLGLIIVGMVQDLLIDIFLK